MTPPTDHAPRPAAPTDPTTAPAAHAGAQAQAPVSPPAVAVAEPRQRWRLTFARAPVPAEAVGRSGQDAWQEALAGSGLPVAGLEASGAGRARIAFAAPLPAGAAGEAELADLWLLERLPAWVVREALAARLPPAHRWVALDDIWLGAPALAGRIVAADWRIAVEGIAAADRARLADAARELLAARTLPRIRVKGTSEKHYDLRPLLADLAIAQPDPTTEAGHAGGAVVRIRTRIDPELGSGRPEEVVAALAEASDCRLAIEGITRERLLLAEDLATQRRR